jgi:hypothetical protein
MLKVDGLDKDSGRRNADSSDIRKKFPYYCPVFPQPLHELSSSTFRAQQAGEGENRLSYGFPQFFNTNARIVEPSVVEC